MRRSGFGVSGKAGLRSASLRFAGSLVFVGA